MGIAFQSQYMAVAQEDNIAIVTLDRADKRNALSKDFITDIHDLFLEISRADGINAVVLAANGDHFCAGLDLVEHHKEERSAEDFMMICRNWHLAFEKMQYCGVPVVAALKGAVVGGGLELASATHIRVADDTTYFALPEGQRGIFTGGGATVRVAGLIGEARMMDMMLTGRVYKHDEAVNVGLCQYFEREMSSFDKAMNIARQATTNPPLSNFAISSGISHMQNMPAHHAYFAEAFIAGITNTQPASKERLQAFTDKKAPKTTG